MKEKEFKEAISLIKEFMSLEESLHKLNIEIADSKLFSIPGRLSDMLIETNFTEEGIDLIFWWLYEDVPKEVTDNMVKYNLESVDALWKYLNKKRYVL